jgi:hypothetical protein
MELIARLVRWSLARPRVLVVDAPGATELRWHAEAELDRRGWPTAISPADTDLLLVLGGPGPELTAAIDLLWSQIPHPRWRVAVDDRAALGEVLDDAVAALTDTGGQRAAAARAPADPWHGADGKVEDEVAGLAMADMAPDRDGLDLDVLTVHLGPVLPGWPTGLVVRASMQGDVLADVRARGVDRQRWEPPAPADGRDTAALLALDVLHRCLVVAGWPARAADVRRLRSHLLDPGAAPTPSDPGAAPTPPDRRRARRVIHGIRTSRTLAWSTRGIGRAPATADLPEARAGDVLDRVRRWCDIAEAAFADGASPQRSNPQPPAPRLPVDRLPALLEGAELAAARLVVASFDLDGTPVETEDKAGHGEAEGAAHA